MTAGAGFRSYRSKMLQPLIATDTSSSPPTSKLRLNSWFISIRRILLEPFNLFEPFRFVAVLFLSPEKQQLEYNGDDTQEAAHQLLEILSIL
ncbi:hypothetical protein Enr10x_21250 [Gimesia panareensis]|uniref:Uncharacterized protein n=1 Tax=Gimesia panareensis TaxID=2527978 RepID=A0A517Q5A7_9PLAN|nr:hypothetical protein [Gimesia panareensis]QDT26815.1 hypothetical protein Enr10x_21250 [Gimesia panareensis]